MWTRYMWLICAASWALAVSSAPAAESSALEASRALVERVLPGRGSEFAIEIITAAEGGLDVYEVSGDQGRVTLRGNTPVSVASALRRYLADGGWGHFSRCGSRVDLPRPLPPPHSTVRVVSPFRIRFAYNFCTLSYTFAWSDPVEWQRELDLLALHGYNAALVIAGVEQSWSDTLTQFGYTDDEARAWLVWPSHQAWQQMSNMERFGGALPASVRRQRLGLGQRIVRRMRELGLEPVLPGYYGIVPTDFGTRHPGATVLGQGTWAGGFARPHMLAPADPLFARVADAFHAAQQKHFGPIRYWAADPFHEGGSTQGVDLAAAGRIIQEAFVRANPDAVWVIQSWGDNPRREILSGLDPEHTLVLDLGCERVENWRGKESFWGMPWLWSVIMNFGGNQGLDHRIETLSRTGPAAWSDPQRQRLAGLSVTPEGIDTLPWVWDFMADQNWMSKPGDWRAWIPGLLRARYGVADPAWVQAWTSMIGATGSSRTDQMPHNSIVCARPSLHPDLKARQWGTAQFHYPPEQVAEAWARLLSQPSAPADPYVYDVVDWGRQALGDYARVLHGRIRAAAEKRDAGAARAAGREMLELCDDLERLLATRREFLLGRWIRDARQWGVTPAEHAGAEWNARMLVTTWNDRPGELNGYSAREWAGLMGSFYRNRWAMFLADLVRALDEGKVFDEKATHDRIRSWEQEWTRRTDRFPAEPQGDALKISRALLEKYLPRIRAAAADPRPDLLRIEGKDVVGAWSYPAQGKTYSRVFRADGSCDLLENGALTPHFKDFRWTVQGRFVVVTRPDGSVCERHGLTDRDTMVFTVESWGPAKRQPASQ